MVNVWKCLFNVQVTIRQQDISCFYQHPNRDYSIHKVQIKNWVSGKSMLRKDKVVNPCYLPTEIIEELPGAIK